MFGLLCLFLLAAYATIWLFASYRRGRCGFCWFCLTLLFSVIGKVVFVWGGVLAPIFMLIVLAILPTKGDDGFDGGYVRITPGEARD